MKKVYKNIVFNLLIMLSIAGCSSTSNSISSSISNNEQTSSSTKEGVTEKAIVIYFSATNNTINVANYISNHINSSIFALEPVDEYTSNDLNWTNSNSRVVKEHNDTNRHVELKNVTFEGFDEAKYIFLGAPVWWQELSWVVDDFVKLNDFSNKTIIPFATSASSGIGSSATNLAKNITGNWLEGKRFSSNVSNGTVINWLEELNIKTA